MRVFARVGPWVLVAACLAVILAVALRAFPPTGGGGPLRRAPAESLAPAAAEQVDGLMAAALRAHVVSGAQVEVMVAGVPAIRKAYGVRTLEPHPVTNDLQTLYELASLTKPVATAGAVMLLVQRGELRLHDRVAAYLPAFAQHGKAKVTVEELLLHTSGLQPSFDRADYQADRATILAHAYASALRSPPGTKFAYSNLGYIVLAELVSTIAHEPFETFCARELFAPLGMTDSFFDTTIDAAHAAHLAPQLPEQTVQKLRDAFGTVPGVNGHAGMLSDADDLARYAQALLNALDNSSHAAGPLAPATVAAMIAPHYVGRGEVRGLGWDLDSAYSRNRGDLLGRGGFGHTGSSGTSLWIDPARRLAIVFVSNAHYPVDGDTLPLEAAIANVVAANLRHVDLRAVRAQAAAFDAAAARSALAWP